MIRYYHHFYGDPYVTHLICTLEQAVMIAEGDLEDGRAAPYCLVTEDGTVYDRDQISDIAQELWKKERAERAANPPPPAPPPQFEEFMGQQWEVTS